MNKQEYLKQLGITQEGEETDNSSYVVSLINSDEYGKVYSKLDKANDLDLMDENQVITEEGSSILYESESEPFLLNLIADFTNDIYQLVISNYNE